MARSRPSVGFSDPFHDEIEMYATALEFVGFEVIALTEPDLTRAIAKVRDLQPDALVTRILPRRLGIELVLQRGARDSRRPGRRRATTAVSPAATTAWVIAHGYRGPDHVSAGVRVG